MRNWIRRYRQRRQRRKDAKRSADIIREFVYLDEVSVFSLLASKEGMIATEVTESHASTLAAELSGSAGASAGVARAESASKMSQSETRTTQVLRKAIIQSTFRDLYLRLRGSLSISPIPAGPLPTIRSSNALEPQSSAGWIIDPANLKRGGLIELTVELEAEPLFQAQSVIRTFLDMIERNQTLAGQAQLADLAEAGAMARMIEQLGAGLIPLRGRAVDYVVLRETSGRKLVVHLDIAEQLGKGADIAPLYIVGVGEESLFWKDIRTLVFRRSEFQVLARILCSDLQTSWSPLKLVDVLGQVAPDLHDALESVNATILGSMATSAAASDVPATRRALSTYAELVADALDIDLPVEDPRLALLLCASDDLSDSPTIPEWRKAMSPIANHVESLSDKKLDPSLASDLRVQAQGVHGLSPIETQTGVQIEAEPVKPIEDQHLLDTEIIAIYW